LSPSALANLRQAERTVRTLLLDFGLLSERAALRSWMSLGPMASSRLGPRIGPMYFLNAHSVVATVLGFCRSALQ